MRYYIADLHFFHAEMNDKMDCRGFATVEEMNEYMIQKWNEKVRKNDEVVILGDFSFGNASQTQEVLNRLQGHLFMIVGNHDRFLRDKKFAHRRFVWIKPYEEMSDNRRKVVLCHYPIMCYKGQYRLNNEGAPRSYMLYGHVHDTTDQRLLEQFQDTVRQTTVTSDLGVVQAIPCNMINCFCMYSDYEPLTLDEWIECDRKRREKNAGHLALQTKLEL